MPESSHGDHRLLVPSARNVAERVLPKLACLRCVDDAMDSVVVLEPKFTGHAPKRAPSQFALQRKAQDLTLSDWPKKGPPILKMIKDALML